MKLTKTKEVFNLKYRVVLLFFVCIQFYTNAQNIVTWEELSAEHGGINSTNIIVVGSNDRLVLTHSCNTNLNRAVRGVIVYGEFVIEDAGGVACGELSLTTDFIFVAQNGLFQVGSEADPFDNDFLITLTGDQEEDIDLSAVIGETPQYIPSSNDMGSTSPSASMIENMVGVDNLSFIMAMGDNARIQMHTTDAINKTSWTKLNGTVDVGSNQLSFTDVTGWEVGDRIVLPSTDYDLNQAEDFTIIGVANGGRDVTIDGNTEFMHFGEVVTHTNGERTWDLDMRGEVGLLSRNVKIKGDVDYDTTQSLKEQNDKFGGHTMVMEHGKMYISGVEFEYMGQGGILGRYPTHWHMLGDVSGQYITKSAYHHTFNKGMTIHGTINSLVEDNVLYESIGHTVFLEDGSEVGNRIIGNLAINARSPRNKDEESPNSKDFSSPTNFWIENADNIFEGNHAAGSEVHGFWFDLFGLNGLSRNLGARREFGFEDNKEGPTHFIGNVAHSIGDKAFGLNHGPMIMGGYEGTDERPQQVDESWNVNDFTVYKSNLAVYSRGIGGDFNEIKIGDVRSGTRLRLNQSINNSLIVGRTANIGNPRSEDEIAEGRSLPNGGSHEGHQLYDGPGGLNNVHFEGFGAPGDYAIKESNAVHKAITHYINKVTFAADIPERNKLRVDTNNNSTETKGIIDIDGSLTGMAGAKILESLNNTYSALYDTGSGVDQDDWNVTIFPPEVVFGMMKIGSRDFYNATPLSDSPQVNGVININDGGDAITSRSIISGFDNEIIDTRLGYGQTDQFVFIANEDVHRYKINIENAPLDFQFYMGDIPIGDSVIFELEGLNINFSEFTYDNTTTYLNRAYTMEELQAATTSSVFRNFSTGNIFVKFVSEMRHGFSFPQPRMTYLDKDYGGVKVNVRYNEDLVLSTNSNTLDNNIVSIYPNPTSNKFQIKLVNNDDNINNIEIMSVLGTVVKKFNYSQSAEYDISNLNNGLYFIMFKNNNTVVYSKKVLKR